MKFNKNTRKIVASVFAAIVTVLFLSVSPNATTVTYSEPLIITQVTTTNETTVFTTTAGTTTSVTTSATTLEETTLETEVAAVTEAATEIVEEQKEVEVPATELVVEVVEEKIDTAAQTEAVIETVETVATEPIFYTEEDYEIVAQEVWSGKWGSGSDRKSRLESAGYDYEKVQEKVNEMKPAQNISESNGILSDYEIKCLVVMLCHENSPRAGAAHNANSVGCMVNRVRDGGWGVSTIYGAISSGCSPYWGWGHGSWCMDNYCTNDMDTGYAYEAVDYYLNNQSSYYGIHSWSAWGDGVHNSYY